MPEFKTKVHIEAPRDFAFRWHQSGGAFNRLTPAWERIRVLSRTGGIEDGEVRLKTKAGPLWINVTAKHSKFIQNEQFFDEMTQGPFRRWEHLHRFESGNSPEQTVLTDEIQYRIKGGWLGNFVAGGMVRRRLEQLFAYRHEVTRSEIEDHYQFSQEPSQTIAVTGASGLVGSAICEFLIGGGHHVIKLERYKTDDFSGAGWNPQTGKINFGEKIDSVNCILHLAGFGVADKRWNQKVKKLIKSSRVEATEKLVEYLERNRLSPESFICASAAGYYGNRGAELLDESAPQGDGFLAETCSQWENSCQFKDDSNVRVANLRFGIILNAGGGALTKMLTPFKFFLGGKLGSGQQYWSWISFFDTLRAIHYAIMKPNLSGPVNLVAPEPVTQKKFSQILATVLSRTSLIPMPGFMLRLVVGEMANELLLASANIQPKKLTDCGFQFVHQKLEDALRFELGRMKVKRES